MNLSLPVCKQPQPLISFTGGINTGSINFKSHKEKVVIVMGATGTGKSRLSIDLATHVPAHHLLGIVDPDADYTATDFRQHALLAIESIIEQDKLPIIAGGSNSFIESLVNDDPYFASRYECCFLWVDVSLPILHRFVSKRVDQMVKAGLVDEVEALFDHQSDYTRGIRRAIGVPELDKFLRAQGNTNLDPETLDTLLQEAVDQIKENTYKLACRQLQKIHRLRDFWGWNLHRIDATEAFLHQGKEANEAWERLVVDPSAMILAQFLYRSRGGALTKPHGRAMIPRTVSPMVAMAAATH